MKEERKLSFEIHFKEDETTSIVAKFFSSSDTMDALDEIDKIRSIRQMKESILKIREICSTDDGRIYYPSLGIELPKARWLAVAAAASYPKGIPIDMVVEKGSLDRKSIAAYCTSANNPTSDFLTVIEDSVHINIRGVEWLFALLMKDGQLPSDTKTK